jgi:hypothetical protein
LSRCDILHKVSVAVKPWIKKAEGWLPITHKLGIKEGNGGCDDHEDRTKLSISKGDQNCIDVDT